MGKWVWSPLTIWAFLSGNCGVFSGSLQWGLHCSQLWNCQGAQSSVCVSQCACVYVCPLSVQPQRVSGVSSGARTVAWLEIQRDPYTYIETPCPATHAEACFREEAIICSDDTRAGISRNKLCAQQHAAFKCIVFKTQWIWQSKMEFLFLLYGIL